MTWCLTEQLDLLRASLPKGMTAQGWYDDGADVTTFSDHGANIAGLYAWGYIVGVADAADLSPMQMLEGFGLRLDPPPPCVIAMGCMCALHARGGDLSAKCDATERRIPRALVKHTPIRLITKGSKP